MEICGFVLVRNCIFSMLEHSEPKLQDVPFFSHLCFDTVMLVSKMYSHSSFSKPDIPKCFLYHERIKCYVRGTLDEL